MDKNYFLQYAAMEKAHWWFQARFNILTNRLLRYKFSISSSVLNVGVATGGTTEMLEKLFSSVTSLEYDKDCCDYLRNKGIDVVEGSIKELPFEDNSFDLVCAFDVIEHVDDDRKAIDELYRVLKPGGCVFITVPAFMFLWSEHDVINHHSRRYTNHQLNVLLNDRFKKKFNSYFNFFLFPAIASVRVLKGLFGSLEGKKPARSDLEIYKPSSLINRVLYKIFDFEKRILEKNKLPFGVSIMYLGERIN